MNVQGAFEMTAPYQAALTTVAATCRNTLRGLGVAIDPVEVRIRVVAPTDELIRTDYIRSVDVAVSCLEQLQPPPAGANVIYGTCHEVGHLAIAAAVGAARLPPVVWDEAIAHYLALDVFLPAVARAHGDSLWPAPYPDYLERERRLATAGGEDRAYHALLGRQTEEIRSLTESAGGPAVLLATVAAVAATSPRAEDWRWKLRGRMRR